MHRFFAACIRAAGLGMFGALGFAEAALAETGQRVRILTMSDPFGIVMRDHAEDFNALVGRPLDLELVGYEALRHQLLLNAFETESRFDLIAIDVAWGKEVAAAGLTLPLDPLIEGEGIETGAFLQTALQDAIVDDQTIGLPVQPHAELLFLNNDLLAEQGLEAPTTTDDVLAVAAELHGSRDGLSGICWNAARGAPLGQTMLHFLAAFGGRPLDEAGRPTLDTPEMHAAIGYALDLARVSPPDILDMAWDERILAFASERCALTYGWTGRSLLLKQNGIDLASGKVGVAAAPHAPWASPVSPLGTWLLAIPSNLAENRVASAFEGLIALTSMDANRLYVQHGVGTLLHTPVMNDPDVTERNPAVAMMGELEKRGELQAWMRPGIDAFQSLTEILGNQVHAVLTGVQTIEEAAAASQESFATLLSE
jgi:multiple sugar transport system substrate-binding protein